MRRLVAAALLCAISCGGMLAAQTPAEDEFELGIRLCDEGRMEETYTDHYDVLKSIGGTVLHVVLHNAEHRTEAVHILARLGVPDVEVDHGLWDYEQLNG